MKVNHCLYVTVT